MLQRNAKKDKELLRCKNKELHHRRGPSRHPVTPEQMNICWTIGIRSGIRDHPLPMESESSLHTRRGQSLHFTIRIEGNSKIGRSIKDQFLNARQPLILKSPQCHKFPVMMPWVRLCIKYLCPPFQKILRKLICCEDSQGQLSLFMMAKRILRNMGVIITKAWPYILKMSL